MKTTKLLSVLILFLGSFYINAQNVASTATLTSGGYQAGALGGNNTFYGSYSGTSIAFDGGTNGIANTFIGTNSGKSNTIGNYNVYIGLSSGILNTTGIGNVCLGPDAGAKNISGSFNTSLGYWAGYNALGSGNLFLGKYAGYNETGSDKLYIDNTNTSTPLVWGDFANDQLKFNGKVGIGAVASFPTNINYANYRLFVTGGILSDEVRITQNVSNAWPDYVFNKDYNLKPLSELETFIKDNGHLPNIPSAAQVKEEGIELGNMAKIQQEKIEELTLYILELNKKLEAQQKQIDALLQNK